MAIGHPLWMAPATQMASPMGAYAFLILPRGEGLLYSAVCAPPIPRPGAGSRRSRLCHTDAPSPPACTATPSQRGARRS